MSKIEIRFRPALLATFSRGGAPVEIRPAMHIRLVGFVPGYAVARRRGRAAFVITRKEWDSLAVATRDEERATDA